MEISRNRRGSCARGEKIRYFNILRVLSITIIYYMYFIRATTKVTLAFNNRSMRFSDIYNDTRALHITHTD